MKAEWFTNEALTLSQPASVPKARCFPACYDDDRCSYPKCTASAPEGEK